MNLFENLQLMKENCESYKLQNKYCDTIIFPISDKNIERLNKTINEYRKLVKYLVPVFNKFEINDLKKLFPHYDGDISSDVRNNPIEYVIQTALNPDAGNAIAENFREVNDKYGPVFNKLIKFLLLGTEETYDDVYDEDGELEAINMELEGYESFIATAKNFIKYNIKNENVDMVKNKLIIIGKTLDKFWNKYKVLINEELNDDILEELFDYQPLYSGDDPMWAYWDVDCMIETDDFFETEVKNALDIYGDLSDIENVKYLNYLLKAFSLFKNKLFENLQSIKLHQKKENLNNDEYINFESKVDYKVLNQENVDFFLNGAGEYRIETPDGEMLTAEIELTNSVMSGPEYYVTLVGDDVTACGRDLTAAILDAVYKFERDSN